MTLYVRLSATQGFCHCHSNKDKVRIIALYMMYRDGVPDEDRTRLFQHARLSISEQDTVNNLVYLGCKIVRVRVDLGCRIRLELMSIAFAGCQRPRQAYEG